jgi:hypothetical protein
VSYVIWRLHRSHAIVMAAALLVLVAVLVPTGLSMAGSYDGAVASCAAAHSCGELPRLLFQGDAPIIDLVIGTMILPALLGVLWGAPLVAGEVQDGTQDLIWTQSITRRRWIATNIAWAMAIAIASGTALTLLISWWRIPENALFDRFSPGPFDVQGIAPVAYSALAMALGIAAGVWLRRVLPAIVTALGAFLALRVAVALFLRQHFIAPVVRNAPLAGSRTRASAHAWSMSDYIASPTGQTSETGVHIPTACQSLFGFGGFNHCLATHGYHRIVTYQPADRFWTFQAVEAGIFTVLAAALLAFAYRRVVTADA